ncbi:MAG: hypothetical protein MUE60_07865 [Candidatus Eisenbacteria bacterium]|jgi:hypothetical protein|nr:hypothetical protein [Candidatus Eisenbacteria bacterium]
MSRIHPATRSLPLALCLLAAPAPARAGWQFDVETGAVLSGYNDVGIPGSTGTRFSLSDDLTTATSPYIRARLTHTFRLRHALSVLAAPLTLEPEGAFGDTVHFAGAAFPAQSRVNGTYRFDSYRLTYRYDVHRSQKVKVGLGITAKIRDAEIALRSGSQYATKINTGFVPLLHGSFEWWFADRSSLLVVADALAAPQGRAEDVLVALRFEAVPPLAIRVGYRILEGGADNDEVYTFALLHYLAMGFTITI